jgi:hypothetical protein
MSLDNKGVQLLYYDNPAFVGTNGPSIHLNPTSFVIYCLESITISKGEVKLLP